MDSINDDFFAKFPSHSKMLKQTAPQSQFSTHQIPVNNNKIIHNKRSNTNSNNTLLTSYLNKKANSLYTLESAEERNAVEIEERMKKKADLRKDLIDQIEQKRKEKLLLRASEKENDEKLYRHHDYTSNKKTNDKQQPKAQSSESTKQSHQKYSKQMQTQTSFDTPKPIIENNVSKKNSSTSTDTQVDATISQENNKIYRFFSQSADLEKKLNTYDHLRDIKEQALEYFESQKLLFNIDNNSINDKSCDDFMHHHQNYMRPKKGHRTERKHFSSEIGKQEFCIFCMLKNVNICSNCLDPDTCALCRRHNNTNIDSEVIEHKASPGKIIEIKDPDLESNIKLKKLEKLNSVQKTLEKLELFNTSNEIDEKPVSGIIVNGAVQSSPYFPIYRALELDIKSPEQQESKRSFVKPVMKQVKREIRSKLVLPDPQDLKRSSYKKNKMKPTLTQIGFTKQEMLLDKFNKF